MRNRHADQHLAEPDPRRHDHRARARSSRSSSPTTRTPGLPFVPTYDVTCRCPTPPGSCRATRCGSAASAWAWSRRSTPRRARAASRSRSWRSKLDEARRADPRRLARDGPAALAARAKYVELEPGESGEPVDPDGDAAARAVGRGGRADEVFDVFDAGTRHVAPARRGAGSGRGSPGAGPTSTSRRRAARAAARTRAGGRQPADPRTGLRRFVRGAERHAGELAPRARRSSARWSRPPT